jgi:hypothetical protein
MRTRISLLLSVAACAVAPAAYAGGPGDVYSDFAQDGALSCNHTRADLVSVLRSGTLNQYGDPLTLARLKLAVRKQLAGGCRANGAPQLGGTAGTQTTVPRGGKTNRSRGGKPANSRPKHKGRPRTPGEAPPSVRRESAASGDSGSFLAGRGLVLGLLAAAVALGGWLTKHALSARG